MKATMLAVLTVLMLSTATHAGDWSTYWTGPNGGAYEGSGKCSNGVCQSSGTFTGPLGGVWHHSGESHLASRPRTVGWGRQACWPKRRNVATLVDLASGGKLINPAIRHLS
jgi:hypothetical protein